MESTRNRIRALLSGLSLLLVVPGLFMLDAGAEEPCTRLERDRDAQQAYLSRIDPSFVTLRHRIQTSVSQISAELEAAQARRDVEFFKGTVFSISGFVLFFSFMTKAQRLAFLRQASTDA